MTDYVYFLILVMFEKMISRSSKNMLTEIYHVFFSFLFCSARWATVNRNCLQSNDDDDDDEDAQLDFEPTFYRSAIFPASVLNY
jgi:hypothetical protein